MSKKEIKNEKEFQAFVKKNICAINDLFEWEEKFSDFSNRKITKYKIQMKIIDRNWLEKWKEIIGYEKIKNKCKEYILNIQQKNILSIIGKTIKNIYKNYSSCGSFFLNLKR